MALTITDTEMTSDVTRYQARRLTATADAPRAWIVEWCPALLWDRNSAITAMSLAEEVATHGPESPLVGDWADELGMTPGEAVREILGHGDA